MRDLNFTKRMNGIVCKAKKYGDKPNGLFQYELNNEGLKHLQIRYIPKFLEVL